MLILPAIVAFIACLAITPLVKRLAIRFDIVDHPDRRRKLHTNAIPLGGGVAVLLATAVATVSIFLSSSSPRDQLITDITFLVGFAAACTIICTVGLLDDRFTLRGRQKVLGQIVAAGILIASGLVIERLTIFEWRIELGLLAIPFTLFWLLGATNALNLLDGMDGLATIIGVVLSAAVGILALLGGHPVDAILAIALAGALAGFLFYNSPPASIFLGDAGAMLVGLVIGSLAIRASLKGPATVALAAPTAILAIPIFDASMAVLRRKLTGRSIYDTDRAHLHHSLQRRGLHGFRAVMFIGVLCAITANAAVISVYMNNEMLAFAAIIAVCAILITTGLFGHHECWLLCRRVKHFLVSLNPFRNHQEHRVQLQTRFQGVQEWDELWGTLIEFADRFELSAVHLNVTLPAVDEEYHASWHRPGTRADSPEFWHSDIPLMAGDVTVGRLKIAGGCCNGSVCGWMGDLIAGLKPFEQHLMELIDDCLVGEPVSPPESAVFVPANVTKLPR